MILCPKCKARTNVYDSRISFDGKTRRKRLCPSCSHRFATIEILDEVRPLEERKPKADKPQVKKPVAPKKVKPVRKEQTTVKATQKRSDEDYFESSLDEDFYEVARELGIGGLDNYD